MAQHLADLPERDAGPQHLRRGGVPQPVGVDLPQSGPLDAAATICVTPPLVNAWCGALTR